MSNFDWVGEHNEIVKLEIELLPDNHYRCRVTKHFASEYGGGESTIDIGGAYHNIHFALEALKSAVTVTKTYKAAFESQPTEEHSE